MMLGSLLAGIVWAAAPVGGEGALAGTGETLGDAVVVGVETHPEYERYALRQPDGAVAIAELTTGTGGLCDVGELTVFPRADLAEGVTGTVGMDALCVRLAERRPTLRSRIGPEAGLVAAPPPEGAPGAGASRPAFADAEGAGEVRSPGAREAGVPRVDTPLRFVILALAVLAVARARPDRLLLGVGAAALVARLVLSPRGVTNGALAGYEKLVLARGTMDRSPYGEAWGALMGALPGWPDGVFWATLALATASAALVAAITRRAAGPRAGLAAGLLFALLPAHVGVSISETMHVSVLAFELGAVLAADAWARGHRLADGLVAALATGIAVHLRPDALPFVVVPVVWAAAAWRGGPAERRGLGRPAVWLGVPALVLATLVGWRVATLGGSPGGLLRAPGLEVLLPRFGAPTQERAYQLFLHAGLTPAVLWGLAAVGVAASWRAGRRASLGVLALWIAVTTLPLSAKVSPVVDAVRLQLAGQAPWLVLAGIGAAALPRWVLPLALLAFLPHYPLRPWVQTEEWRFLRATVPTLPEGTTVRYDARPQRAPAFAAVMEQLGPAAWSSRRGELRYVGVDCRAQGGCDTSGCVAERVTRLEGRVDLDLVLEERTIGFWRCPSASTPP